MPEQPQDNHNNSILGSLLDLAPDYVNDLNLALVTNDHRNDQPSPPASSLPTRDQFLANGVVSLSNSQARPRDVCPICLESIDARTPQDLDGAVVIISCAHIFHRECLWPWIMDVSNSRNGTCPTCRCNLFLRPGNHNNLNHSLENMRRQLEVSQTYEDELTQLSERLSRQSEAMNAQLEVLAALHEDISAVPANAGDPAPGDAIFGSLTALRDAIREVQEEYRQIAEEGAVLHERRRRTMERPGIGQGEENDNGEGPSHQPSHAQNRQSTENSLSGDSSAWYEPIPELQELSELRERALGELCDLFEGNDNQLEDQQSTDGDDITVEEQALLEEMERGRGQETYGLGRWDTEEHDGDLDDFGPF